MNLAFFDIVFCIFNKKNSVNVFNKRFIRGRQRLTCRRIDKYFRRLYTKVCSFIEICKEVEIH